MKIKYLPKEFVKKSVRYTLLDKNEVFVLYRCESITYGYSYFEVFKPRIGKPHPMSDEDYDMVELYPSDELFGIYAFCCSNEASLLKIMKNEFGIDYNVKKDYKFNVSDW